MARQPKVDLNSIIQPKDTSGSPIPAPTPEPTPESPVSQKRSYPSREGKVPIQCFVEKNVHRQLKIAAAEKGMTTQEIMIKALNDWCVMNDLPPIA